MSADGRSPEQSTVLIPDCNVRFAYVYVGDTFVHLELVRQGQAVLYTVLPNIAHVEDYRKAQQEAREARRGMWDQDKPLDVRPDCYRKLKKEREC